MKKLLLVLVPAVLLLTSCNRDSGEEVITPPEAFLYNDFQFVMEKSANVLAMLDDYIETYINAAGDLVVPEMEVVDNQDGTFSITIDFEANKLSRYNTYYGQLNATLTLLTPGETEFSNANVKKEIDLSSLKYRDSYYQIGFHGSVAVTDDENESSSNKKYQNLLYTNLGISLEGYTTIVCSIDGGIVTYIHEGLSTADQSDDTHTWVSSPEQIFGNHATYGTYTVTIDSDIVVKSNYFTGGKYTFTASKIGSGLQPFTVVFRGKGAGSVLIVTTDGEQFWGI